MPMNIRFQNAEWPVLSNEMYGLYINTAHQTLTVHQHSTYLSVLRPQKEVPWMVVVAMMAHDAPPSLATVLVFTRPAGLCQPALCARH
jgi:hypothetical protein